jgi:anti-anti-sigma regulatory factor
VPCDVGGMTDQDAGTVDVLARLQLAARRHGGRIRLLNPRRELQALLALTGLDEVVACESGLQGGGQAEQGKQAARLEEQGEPADPPV